MGSGPRLRTRLWLGALALAGVAVAHGLTYLLLVPDAGARERLLAATGHGYWRYVMPIALGATVAALAGFAARGPAASPDGLFRATALRLAMIQSVSFVALEMAERLIAHGSLLSLISEPFVLIGVFVQVAMAVAGALVVVVLARVVEHFSGRRVPSLRPARTSLPRAALRTALPSFRVATGGATLRGPPIAA